MRLEIWKVKCEVVRIKCSQRKQSKWASKQARRMWVSNELRAADYRLQKTADSKLVVLCVRP